MLKNVVLGWLGRRALEVGGLVGTLWSAYSVLPPERQEVVNRILSGEWQDITLGALVPFAVYIGSQVLSFRATVQPQVVTADGTKARLPDLAPSTRAKVQVDVANKKIDAKKAAPDRGFRFPNPLDWFVDRG
jgi:hypothetical protein